MAEADARVAYLDKVLSNLPSRYSDKERLRNDVAAFVRQCDTVTPVVETRSGWFYLHGVLPINYGGSSYNIPVNIDFDGGYPRDAPRCFVTPIEGMELARNLPYLDSRGMIVLPYLRSWNQVSSLTDLTGLITSAFEAKPPVWAVKPQTVEPSVYAARTAAAVAAAAAAAATAATANIPTAAASLLLEGLHAAGCLSADDLRKMKMEQEKKALLRALEKAKADLCLQTAYDTYKIMAKSKEFYRSDGTLDVAKEAWKALANVACERVKELYAEKYKEVRAKRGKDPFMCLASSPEIGLDGMPVLEIAAWAVRAVGGKNIAGDAHDQFHKLLMDAKMMEEELKGWRTAWQGKTECFLECDEEDVAQPVTCYSLKGGFETDWERQYLLGRFRQVHARRTINVVCFDNFQELLDHLAAM